MRPGLAAQYKPIQIHQSTYPSSHLFSTSESIHPSMNLRAHPSIHLPMNLPIHRPSITHPSMNLLPIHPSMNLPTHHPRIYESTHPSIHPPTLESIHQSTSRPSLPPSHSPTHFQHNWTTALLCYLASCLLPAKGAHLANARVHINSS